MPTADVEENFGAEKFETYGMKGTEEKPRRPSYTKKARNPTDGSVNYGYSSSSSSSPNLPTISEHSEQYSTYGIKPDSDEKSSFETWDSLRNEWIKSKPRDFQGKHACVDEPGVDEPGVGVVGAAALSRRVRCAQRPLQWLAGFIVIFAGQGLCIYFIMRSNTAYGRINPDGTVLKTGVIGGVILAPQQHPSTYSRLEPKRLMLSQKRDSSTTTPVGQVAASSTPKPVGKHAASSTPKPVTQVAASSPPKPVGQDAATLPPKPVGQVAASSAPKPVGQVAASSTPKAVREHNTEKSNKEKKRRRDSNKELLETSDTSNALKRSYTRQQNSAKSRLKPYNDRPVVERPHPRETVKLSRKKSRRPNGPKVDKNQLERKAIPKVKKFRFQKNENKASEYTERQIDHKLMAKAQKKEKTTTEETTIEKKEIGAAASPCPAEELACVDGRCITLAMFCDGQIDCSDHADEDNCFA